MPLRIVLSTFVMGLAGAAPALAQQSEASFLCQRPQQDIGRGTHFEIYQALTAKEDYRQCILEFARKQTQEIGESRTETARGEAATSTSQSSSGQ